MASGKNKGRKRPPPKRPSGPATKGRPTAPAKPSAGATPATPPTATATAGAGAGAKQPTPAAPKPTTAPKPGAPGKSTRAERIEAARKARRRKAMRTRLGVGAVVAVILGLIVTTVVNNNRKESEERERLTAGGCTFDTRSDDTAASTGSRRHTPPASYDVDPPAGGNHAPGAAPAGVFGGEGTPAPSDGELVHSLEHGYVVLWHKPDLSDADLDEVKKAYDAYPRDVLVVPHATTPGKVAATAWGKRLLCDEIDSEALTEFVRLYRNEGPEKVPH